MTNERLEEIRQKYIAFDRPDYYNCNELLREIDDLKSELRGYNAMMADRHRILEENFKMKEALKKLKCVSSEKNWVKLLIEEVLG